MKIIAISLEENLAAEAEKILDDMGLDIETVVKMMVKKIKNEQNINFLISPRTVANTSQRIEPLGNLKPIENEVNNKMTKSKAVNIFRKEGFDFTGITTFASKNKSAYNYWANPDVTVLSNNWNIILNDWINQEIHLFNIPANTINPNSVVYRADKVNQIDLQIMYDDRTFTDMRSKISFEQYWVKSYKY